jgi:hypothetical protein
MQTRQADVRLKRLSLIPQGDLEQGQYYIKASDAFGEVYATSDLLRVVHGPQKRRLYGPTMFI